MDIKKYTEAKGLEKRIGELQDFLEDWKFDKLDEYLDGKLKELVKNKISVLEKEFVDL